MNETEQIPFHKKRRQHFLTEEKYQKEKNGYLSNLSFWNDNWSDSSLESKNLFRFKSSEIFDYVIQQVNLFHYYPPCLMRLWIYWKLPLNSGSKTKPN